MTKQRTNTRMRTGKGAYGFRTAVSSGDAALTRTRSPFRSPKPCGPSRLQAVASGASRGAAAAPDVMMRSAGGAAVVAAEALPVARVRA